MQEATDECMKGWSNKSMFLSLSLSLSRCSSLSKSLLQTESSHVFSSPPIPYHTHTHTHISCTVFKQTICGSPNKHCFPDCSFPPTGHGSLQQVFLSSTTSTCRNPKLGSNTFISIKTSQHHSLGASTLVPCTFCLVTITICDLWL